MDSFWYVVTGEYVVLGLAAVYELIDRWWRRRALRRLALLLFTQHPVSTRPPTVLLDRGELLR